MQQKCLGSFEGVLEDDHLNAPAQALGKIAKTEGMTKVTLETKPKREPIYPALSTGGKWEPAAFLKAFGR